jgi:hypothetical protein
MTNMPDHAQPKGWTAGQVLLAVVLILLGIGITFPAFAVIYLTVTHLVSPWFHAWSWTVPASGEIAFVGIWGTGVLLAWRGESGGALRPVFLTVFIAGSVYLNVYAAHGAGPDAVGHILVVAAFFGYLLVGKSAIMRLRAAKGRPDRLTAIEWALHPYRSAVLRSRMALWGETSRKRALPKLSALLYATALAQADPRIGRVPFAWRSHLPVTLRYQLSAGEFPAPVADAIRYSNPWHEAVAAWVKAELKLLDTAPAEGSARGTGGGTSGGTSRGGAEGTSGGSRQGTSRSSRESSDGRSDWPESKAIDRALLVRRTKAAMKRWEGKHGKPLPATQLGAQLKVRMSRDTATALLDEAGRPPLAEVRSLQR